MGQWWSKVGAGVEQGRDVACLAVFDPGTNSALSQLLARKNQKTAFGVIRSRAHDISFVTIRTKQTVAVRRGRRVKRPGERLFDYAARDLVLLV